MATLNTKLSSSSMLPSLVSPSSSSIFSTSDMLSPSSSAMFGSTTTISPLISPAPISGVYGVTDTPLHLNHQQSYQRLIGDEKYFNEGRSDHDQYNNDNEDLDEEEEETKKFTINKDLLIYKAFYFLFYGAVGSLFPYLAVFYKQLYLSAQQVGFLIGIRPFIQMCTVPLWGALADTYNVKKIILLMSIIAWLATNYSIIIVRIPPETACNSTIGMIRFPKIGQLVESQPVGLRNMSLNPAKPDHYSVKNNTTVKKAKKVRNKREDMPEQTEEEIVMLTLTRIEKIKTHEETNIKQNIPSLQGKRKHNGKKRRMRNEFLAIIYSRSPINSRFQRSTDVRNAPNSLWSRLNTSLKDTGTPLQRILATDELEEEFDTLNTDDEYPWPLDNIETTADATERPKESLNIFSVLIIITIFGTVLASPAATMADTATLERLGEQSYQYGYQRLWGAFGWGLCAFVVGAVVSSIQLAECKQGHHVDYILSFYVYAVMMGFAFLCAAFFKFNPVERTADYTDSLWEAIKTFRDVQHVLFVLTLLVTGASMGFVHTFLFWHLHDLGGTQFLFSVISAVQCISEVLMYLLSTYLLLHIGCDNVLYIGLLSNVIRLFAYSVLTQPIYSIALEILQGVSSASIWTAAICYIGLIPGAPVTLQAVLHGVYWGLGHGGGGILGGILVTYVGSHATFIAYGLICLINLLLLVALKYQSKIMESICNYTYVETIPAGTYILTSMSQRQHSQNETNETSTTK